MTNGLRAIHPGEILREEYLLSLCGSGRALSQALRVPPTRINEIVRETRAVAPDTALRLARFFGGDARSWMNLQIAYDQAVTTAKSNSTAGLPCWRLRGCRSKIDTALRSATN
jgi:antitoxin HigA-1